MTAFQTLAILLTFAALGSYINDRFLRLPTSIGMMLFALLLSWTGMIFGKLGLIDLAPASDFIGQIDFSDIMLHGILSFLLFAGALQVDLTELKKYKIVVAFLATVGVIIATFITGSIVWLAARPLGLGLSYIDALIFGALISPTDPVAVMSILKEARVAKGLRIKIASESLLNDGVGVVLFLVLLYLGVQPESNLPLWQVVGAFLVSAVIGSVILGLAMGFIAYYLLRATDDYKTEILVTLALATGGYCFAEAVNVSAPITMVVAGIIIGNHGRHFGLSSKGRKHLDMFWELLDDIINAILFILIGLEIMIMPVIDAFLAIGLCGIIATLIGRFISVAIPIAALRSHFLFQKGAIRLMTWGGLRGGISIAMALSLPATPAKNIILSMTYVTVIFSVLFQGTTFKHLVRKIAGRTDATLH